LAYALASVSLQEQIELLNQGTSRQGLNFDQVGGLQILLPTIAEQRAIADFLDHETSRIDQLKSLNRRQIELLKEKRQALITAAVTGKIPGARGAV
jgi:type I restriction enzyme S subunit